MDSKLWAFVAVVVAAILVGYMIIMIDRSKQRAKRRHRASINDIPRSSRVTSREGFAPDQTSSTQSTWALHPHETDDDRDTTDCDEPSMNSVSDGSNDTPAEHSAPSDPHTATPDTTPSSLSPSPESGANSTPPPSTDAGSSSIPPSI